MLSVSILGIKDKLKENIDRLDNLDIDYFHVDVMDGVFVPNKTFDYQEMEPILMNRKVKLDVHLMVNDVKKYIDDYCLLNPSFITFHYEAICDKREIINYIKSKGIKVGLSIKPNTDVSLIEDLLDSVNLVLVMSVEPGFGGQSFIPSTSLKIKQLCEIREKRKLNFVIEVDGGINDITKSCVVGADILVVGSYITNGNYEKQIETFKKA